MTMTRERGVRVCGCSRLLLLAILPAAAAASAVHDPQGPLCNSRHSSSSSGGAGRGAAWSLLPSRSSSRLLSPPIEQLKVISRLRGGAAVGSGSRRSKASAVVGESASASRAVEKTLFPLYLVLLIDAIGMGIALPALPFHIMGLGAGAFRLSLVVCSNYLTQILGSVFAGALSDRFGRRPVLMLCIGVSALSYLLVGRSTSLLTCALARVVGGVVGGVSPIAQSCVADVTSQDERPQYMGRIQACIGAGFVIGPMIATTLSEVFHFSLSKSFYAATFVALSSLVLTAFSMPETHAMHKDNGEEAEEKRARKAANKKAKLREKQVEAAAKMAKRSFPIPFSVLLLVLNGFLLMYAFSLETVYAMFIRDNFGFGEVTLSKLFATNGALIMVLQLYFMKPLVRRLGKHMLLVLGNLLLAGGLSGMCLQRDPLAHFSLFSVHIVGYSISDTALVSLISRYSDEENQGRALGLNSAALCCARVISPLASGWLYEMSREQGHDPIGTLPYLVGSLCPLLGVSVPLYLYFNTVKRKRLLKLA